MIAANHPRQISRPRLRGQRTGCDNHWIALGRRRNRRHLFARDRDPRMPGERGGDGLGEPLAVHRQRGAGRHAARLGGSHHNRVQTPHLLLEESDGVIELVTAKRVAADELRESIGLVNRRGAGGTHFVEKDRDAARRRLPCSLAAGEAAPDDANGHQWAILRLVDLRLAGFRALTFATIGSGVRPARRGRDVPAAARPRRLARGGALRRASISARASLRLSPAGSVPLGTDAFVSPSVTYGP